MPHKQSFRKFAHICWSNKLLFPDTPLPFDTNEPGLKISTQFEKYEPVQNKITH